MLHFKEFCCRTLHVLITNVFKCIDVVVFTSYTTFGIIRVNKNEEVSLEVEI